MFVAGWLLVRCIIETHLADECFGTAYSKQPDGRLVICSISFCHYTVERTALKVTSFAVKPFSKLLQVETTQVVFFCQPALLCGQHTPFYIVKSIEGMCIRINGQQDSLI